MILYHHTDPAYLPSILERGLIARPWGANDDSPETRALLSAILHNRSVVWLTTQPSTLLTEADITFLRQQGREDEIPPDGMWLSRCEVSLKIDIPKHSKRLFHYWTWAKKNEVEIVDEEGFARCNDAGELMTTANVVWRGHLPSTALWYVHFGDIPPKRITAPLPRHVAGAL
jgi:hypothetical protein